MNLGVVYQNIDQGSLSPSFRYGTAFRYPTATSHKMLANSTPINACPTDYGCVPGAVTVPATWVGGNGGTDIGLRFPDDAIKDERIVQLDLKVSKNLRFGRISVAPAFEAFNLFNIDQVHGREDDEYGNASGSYLQPSNML